MTLSNASAGANIGSPALATVTINDEDPTPTLAISNVSQNEGNSGTTPFAFSVSLSAVSGRSVTVNYATASGTTNPATSGSCPTNDFASQSGTLTFNPTTTSAVGETVKTVTVQACGDTTAEANETFFVNLTGPVNATLTTAQGVGTIS